MADEKKKPFGNLLDFSKLKQEETEKVDPKSATSSPTAPKKRATSRRRKIVEPPIVAPTTFSNIVNGATPVEVIKSLSRHGKNASAKVNSLTKKYIGVADLDDNIESNFRVIAKQMSILANFALNIDKQINGIQVSTSKALSALENTHREQQQTLVKAISSRIESIENKIQKVDGRIDSQDKQIDELYEIIKSNQAKTSTGDFLKNKKNTSKIPLDENKTVATGSINQDGGGGGGLMNLASLASIIPLLLVGGAGYLGYKSGLFNPLLNFSGDSSRVGDKKRPYSWWEKLMGSDTRDGLAAMRDQRDGKETPTEKTSGDDISVVSKNDILFDAKNDVKITAQKRIVLKADSIVLDAKNIEINGKQPDGKQSTPPASEESASAAKSGASTGLSNAPLVTQNPFDPKKGQAPTPNYGSGVGGSGGFGGGGGDFGGADNSSGPEVSVPEKKEEIPTGNQVPSSENKSKEGRFRVLREQRGRFREAFDNDPNLKLKMAAMAISEVGYKHDDSIRGLVETTLNRAYAQKKDLNDTGLLRRFAPGDKRNYYAPYNDGSFDRNMRFLENNPKILERVMSDIDAVLDGSNDSNLGTDNGSAGVAANARRNQSITVDKSSSGETFSRKDRNAAEDGPGVVANNRKFAKESQAAIDKELQEAKTNPSGPPTEPQQVSKTEAVPQRQQTQPQQAGKTETIPTNANDAIGPLRNVRRKENTNDPMYRMFKVGNRTPFNYALSPAGQRELGAIGTNLTKIKTKNGLTMTVNKNDASDMLGMLNELIDRGYDIKSLGGFALRKNANNPSKWSTHATGATVDINPGRNPNKSNLTDMPEGVKYVAMKWGFAQLSFDKMHFERVPPNFRTEYLKRLIEMGKLSKDDPFLKERIKDGVIDQKTIDEINAPPQANAQTQKSDIGEVDPKNATPSTNFSLGHHSLKRPDKVQGDTSSIGLPNGTINTQIPLIAPDGTIQLPERVVIKSKENTPVKAAAPDPKLVSKPKTVPENPKDVKPKTEKASDPGKDKTTKTDPKAPQKNDGNGSKGNEPMYASNPSGADNSYPAPGDDGSGQTCSSICNL